MQKISRCTEHSADVVYLNCKPILFTRLNRFVKTKADFIAFIDKNYEKAGTYQLSGIFGEFMQYDKVGGAV